MKSNEMTIKCQKCGELHKVFTFVRCMGCGHHFEITPDADRCPACGIGENVLICRKCETILRVNGQVIDEKYFE